MCDYPIRGIVYKPLSIVYSILEGFLCSYIKKCYKAKIIMEYLHILSQQFICCDSKKIRKDNNFIIWNKSIALFYSKDG